MVRAVFGAGLRRAVTPVRATARARITQFAEAKSTLRRLRLLAMGPRIDALRDSAARSGPAIAASFDVWAAIRNSTCDMCGSAAMSGRLSAPWQPTPASMPMWAFIPGCHWLSFNARAPQDHGHHQRSSPATVRR